jgi:hypothetical protein
MIGKKINQLATELAPASTDLTIIGDPVSGVSKKITLAQLGAIFSGAVSFYTNLAAFPTPGTTDVIYCAKDTQKLYLWSGSAYVEVFPSQSLLDTYQLRSEKGVSNGYASLDSGGKVPISQLPSSIMEYKGTWNASTNTPTLANGTGDTGDVYICNVAGTVNFGAGAITFAVGDYVIYSGTIWQRSSGAVGTVTSVALTVGGDAISVSGSPLTTSGTLALAFSGTTSQYIRGNGTLANFPTSLVSGSGTANRLTKWSSTSGEIVNSNIFDTGTTITNLNATADFFSCQFNGNATTGRSYGALIVAGSNASDIALRIENVSSTSVYFYVWGDGRVQINNIPNATTDTDKFLVSDSGVIKYRTGAELLSDIGGASASGYVPYTGATANVDLGTHTLIAAKGTFSSSGSGDTVGVTHSSGSGKALNITKGGNGEGLYINKTSGSGNAATIIGTLNATTLVKSGGTSAQFLKADGSVDSTAYGTGSVTSVGLSSATSGISIFSTPITTSGTITIDISTASASGQGLLSSTDWTTFNNKQPQLNGTGFVKASGTTISYDNSTYLTTSAASSTYLPLAGGTLTGALGGTSATFSGNVAVGQGSTGAVNIGGTTPSINAASFLRLQGSNTAQNYEISVNQYVANSISITPSTSLGGTTYTTPIFTMSSATGLSVTGAATFSSSVTANSTINGYFGGITTGQSPASSGTSPNNPMLSLTNNRGVGLYVGGQHASPFGIWLQVSDTSNLGTNYPLLLQPNGGNVGIGTTSPALKFNISNGGAQGFEFDPIGGNGGVGLIQCYNRSTSAYASIQFDAVDYRFTNAGTERMRITSGGNVGIGTTSPGRNLTVATSGESYVSVTGGASADVGYLFGTSASDAKGRLIYNNADNMQFWTNSTERMRITSGGQISQTTSIADWSHVITNASTTSPNGIIIQYTAANKNNTSNPFLYCTDNSGTTLRFEVRSNGGIANYQANDVNLSDIRTKKDITPLGSYWDKFKAIEMVKFKYKDQTHDDFNIGVIAQQVEKVAPEFVDVDGWGDTPKDGVPLKSIYTADLHHATIKVLQEAMAKIEDLQNQLDTLKNK